MRNVNKFMTSQISSFYKYVWFIIRMLCFVVYV